jgi:hypothetical protein
MRAARLLLAGLALCGLGSGLRAQPSDDVRSERDLVRGQFAADRQSEDRDARIVTAWADLNGDGRPEAIVYVLAGAYCGTGGCALLVLTRAGHRWRKVADMTIVNPPVRLLATSSHGWRDLAVTVAGGGARAHEALIAFNGRAYPSNPSMPPARTLRRRVPGRVLIFDGDRGQPLF